MGGSVLGAVLTGLGRSGNRQACADQVGRGSFFFVKNVRVVPVVSRRVLFKVSGAFGEVDCEEFHLFV